MRNFLWNLNFDSNINHFIFLGSIYFKLKLEVCKFIPLTNSVNFRFIQFNTVKLLTKILDYIINNANLNFDFWSVVTIFKLIFKWNWNTLVDYLLQIWFCTVIFHTFRFIHIFLFNSNNLKVDISKTSNLEPGMPKSQIICSQSFDVFAFVVWKIWKCFFLFHRNHDIFVTIIATNMKLCTKEARTPKWIWRKFQSCSFSILRNIAI